MATTGVVAGGMLETADCRFAKGKLDTPPQANMPTKRGHGTFAENALIGGRAVRARLGHARATDRRGVRHGLRRLRMPAAIAVRDRTSDGAARPHPADSAESRPPMNRRALLARLRAHGAGAIAKARSTGERRHGRRPRSPPPGLCAQSPEHYRARQTLVSGWLATGPTLPVSGKLDELAELLVPRGGGGRCGFVLHSLAAGTDHRANLR